MSRIFATIRLCQFSGSREKALANDLVVTTLYTYKIVTHGNNYVNNEYRFRATGEQPKEKLYS